MQDKIGYLFLFIIKLVTITCDMVRYQNMGREKQLYFGSILSVVDVFEKISSRSAEIKAIYDHYVMNNSDIRNGILLSGKRRKQQHFVFSAPSTFRRWLYFDWQWGKVWSGQNVSTNKANSKELKTIMRTSSCFATLVVWHPQKRHRFCKYKYLPVLDLPYIHILQVKCP